MNHKNVHFVRKMTGVVREVWKKAQMKGMKYGVLLVETSEL